MRRVWAQALLVFTAMLVTTFGWVAAASAAGDGEKVGQNVGHLLGGWARSLYVGIVAIVALGFLINRKFTDLAVFVLAALLVGGFVLAPGEVASTIRGIWDTITA
jgi:hypothetical protein